MVADRESPLLEELVYELRQHCTDRDVDILPQVIFVDGSGVLHPRGVGLATHFGVRVGIPTIGIGELLSSTLFAAWPYTCMASCNRLEFLM